VYHGGNVLFQTRDGGETWTPISGDLTRDDKTKQRWSGGPITGDNTGAEYYDTIFAVAESPRERGLIWAGTDDGLVHVTRDGGKTWTNLTANVPGLPEWGTVAAIEPSPFDAAAAYVVVDAHRLDDPRPYLWKTADYGKTWKSLAAGLSKGVYLHAVREDPRKQGLLYVGTEKGVSYSPDDGASWKELRLNLPTVAVHDLVVKEDDLVVGTHGRSIWILDDLTPLREWSQQVEAEAVHLFTARPAVRWRYDGAVSSHLKGPGRNPPAGTVLQYWLKDEPKGDITVEILDEKGGLVRKLSSRKIEPETPPDDPDAAEEETAKKPLPKQAGLQRAVWDLRYEGATKIKGAKVDSGDPAEGPLALPGTCTARLTVDGRTFTTPVEILPDPRVTVSRADLEQQLAFALALREDLTRLSGTVHQLRSVRDQVKARRGSMGGGPEVAPLADAADALVARCDALEEKLHNPKAEVSYDILARPGGAKLYSRLVPLYSAVNDGDGRPTQGMREVYAELKKELDALRAEWQAILETDVPALNAKAADLLPTGSCCPAGLAGAAAASQSVSLSIAMKRTRATVGLLAVAVTAACRVASPPAPESRGSPAVAPTEAARADIGPIVEAFRKIVVLLEAEDSLPPADRERARLVGWILFEENRARVEALGRRLAAEAARGALAGPAAFLDDLERDPDLWDADKLVFKDLLEDLRAALADLPQTSAEQQRLVARLDEDRAALGAIQARYDREITRLYERLGTRGMPLRRQSWEEYLAKLRTRYSAGAILAARASDTAGITDLRAGPGGEDAVETSGLGLPRKSFLLTFDDGPHPRLTDRILDVLGRFGAPAVFFELGENLGTLKADDTLQPTRAAAASRRLLAAGQVLANHSYDHALLPKLSAPDLAREIELTNRALAEVSAAPLGLFRPPYGARNARVLAALRERGMKSVLWNVDSRDWADPVPRSIADRVVREAEEQGRGIILFHDIHARTVEALPLVIDTLQSRGYRFVGWSGAPPARAGAPGAAAPSPARAPGGPMYRESWAVVVGIDAYRHWPRLSYAANDARAVQDLLVRRYLFKPENVTLLLDEQATRESVLAALGDRLADPARVSKEDRVFVFFAGHGATRRLSSGRSLGYIIPVDADLANYQSQAISMTNFQDISEAIPAKHVFFVTDACYSGVALTRGAPPAGRSYLEEVTRRSVRQMLTAGGADEEVADNGPNGHSVFTWTFLQGLEGRADLSGDGYVTASELAAYVTPSVSSLSRQTPVFGNLPGSEGGDFVFELKHEAEYLSQESGQLDDEAIRLNTELDRIRAQLAEKRARNEQLRRELEAARVQLGGGPAAAPPASPSRRIDRGTVLFREKRYPEALAEFEEAARLDPKSALAANNVGFTHYRLGDMEKAVAWFEKTLALDPNRAIAHANLGDAFLALGRKAEARREYASFLRLQPTARYADEVRRRLAGLD
jgi:peptidoglycan/xylan/chitin deacetylase (PgdA/CDA1 family)/uncharacterized caspase-like protein/photosystem II stability/assembly factor-like uncharacterized protein